MNGEGRSTPPRALVGRALLAALALILSTGLMTGAAHAAPGDTQALSSGDTPTLSSDGRYVGFRWNGWHTDHYGPPAGAFVLDRSTGLKYPISTEATDWEPYDEISRGNNVAISADGHFAAFMSQTYLYFDENSIFRYEVLLHERESGVTEQVTQFDTASNYATSSFHVAISGNGRYVVFDTYLSSLVPGDTNGVLDVLLYDRTTRTFSRVSRSAAGTQGNGHSFNATITPDGRYVAFLSDASNLVPGDTNGGVDVFLHDRQTGSTQRVNLDPNGQQTAAAPYSRMHRWVYAQPALSADARFVAFASAAATLVTGDTNEALDIFVRDRLSGTVERVNVGPNGEQANWMVSPVVSLSGDGRYVAFTTSASNIVPSDTNNAFDVFVRDRFTGRTERASVTSNGVEFPQWMRGAFEPALSADGRFVAFDSNYTVYLHELGLTTTSAFAFTVKPRALDFGNQALNTNTTLSFWLRNKGTAALPISSVGLVGLHPDMFSLDNRCGISVAVGGYCSVRVSFRPTSVGAKSAKLRVVAGDTDVRTRDLVGTGVISQFAVLPTALEFGSVPINTTSPAQIVTISNTGSAVLPIDSITLDGRNPYQFARTHDCPSNLAVGGSCRISVVCKPTSVGSKAALVNIRSVGGAAIQSVALAGAGR